MSEISNTVQLLEKATSRYICLECKPSLSCDATKYSTLETHFIEKHDKLSESLCPYCLRRVSTVSIVKHIDHHFTIVHKQPYICPICNTMRPTAKSLALHAKEQHRFNGPCLFYKCGHCDLPMKNFEALKAHLDSSSVTLYHCAFPRCLVKSTNENLVFNHVTKVHNQDQKYIISSSEFTCSWPKCHQPFDEESSKPLPQISADQSLFLSCPNCTFATYRMESFAQHVSTCKLNNNLHQFSVSCNLYKCPVCNKASTSHSFVLEHLSDMHPNYKLSSEIIQEDFVVPLDDSIRGDFSSSFLNGDLRSSAFNPQSIAELSTLLTQSMVNPFTNLDSSQNASLLSNFAALIGTAATPEALLSNTNGLSSTSLLDEDTITRKLLETAAAGTSGVNLSLSNGPTPIGAIEVAPVELNEVSKAFVHKIIADLNLKSGVDPTDHFPSILPTNQTVIEWVPLYFNEIDFITSFLKSKPCSSMADISEEELTYIIDKLRVFSIYRIPILGRANQRRVAACPMCFKSFNHGFSDLKKHILCSHFEIRRDVVRFSNNFTYTPRYNTPGLVLPATNLPGTPVKLDGSTPIITNPIKPPINSEDSILSGMKNGFKFMKNVSSNMMAPSPDSGSLLNSPSVKFLPGGKSTINHLPMGSISGNSVPATELSIYIPNIEDASTLEEAEMNKPAGRGGIVLLNENDEPLQDSLQACLQDDDADPRIVHHPIMAKQWIMLNYSLPVLKTLLSDPKTKYSEVEKINYVNRLNRYSSYHVILDVSGMTSTSRKFSCALCNYSSVHSLADVRKHIMGSHCGISPKRFRLLLRASRHDSTNYRLCTDERMLQFVELHQKRTGGSSLASGGSQSSSLKNGNDGKHSSNPSSVMTSNCESEESACEDGENSTCPDDETSSNGPINGREPPIISTPTLRTPVVTASQSGFSFPTKSPSKDDIALLRKEVDRLQGHINNPQEGSEFHTNAGALIQLRAGEIGQRVDLPYSEAVLKTLMEREQSREDISSLIERMNIYSRYHLIVVSRGRRIHAYICVCGRRFSVVREETDVDIRPASLADCRRHILGVHARIPQDLLTICCQASRISKESSYKLYADKALLALADHHKMRTMKQPLTPAQNSSAPTMVPLVETSKILEDKKPIDVSNDIMLAPLVNNFSRGRPAHVGRYGEDVPEVPDDRHSGLNLPGTGVLSIEEGLALVIKFKLPHTWRLERIINLPYSDKVFRELVGQQMKLEADFVDSLINRMEVYSQHSVYIIRQNTSRQNNQRFYACSACLNTSPHGLGDMRKHILGVHAHVPERFKGAAMNAGRLNRDDYQLYTDEQLMALSQSPMRGGNMRGSNHDTMSKSSITKRGNSSLSLNGTVDKKPRIMAGNIPIPSDVIPSVKKEEKMDEEDTKSSIIQENNDNSKNRISSQNLSVWPGQEDDEDLFSALPLPMKIDDSYIPTYSIKPEFEDLNNEHKETLSPSSSPSNGRLPRVTISLNVKNGGSTSPERPPIKLTLRNLKTNHQTEKDEPIVNLDTRSRRSMSLKSKKPLPALEAKKDRALSNR